MKPKTMYCKQCGKLVDVDSNLCPSCGGELEYRSSDIEKESQESSATTNKNGLHARLEYSVKVLEFIGGGILRLLKWITKYGWRVLLLFIGVVAIGILTLGYFGSESFDKIWYFLAIITLTPTILYICCWRSIKFALASAAVLFAVLIISYGILIGTRVNIYGNQTTYLDKIKREFYWLTPDFTIPNGITSIEEDAFKGCKYLTSVTIPDGVTSIGQYAFECCNNLSSINIPKGVTTIEEGTFSGCYHLARVKIPNSVTSIGDHAFLDCSSMKSVKIPNSVTSIGRSAFRNCHKLTSITIPKSVNSIGEGAFSGCGNLQAFNGKYASSDHRCVITNGVLISVAQLVSTSYTIPNSVTSIGEYAFLSCDKLKSLTIPKSVTSIGSYAFAGCYNLTKIYCKPTTPPAVGVLIFYDLPSFPNIYVPRKSLDTYKSESFGGYTDIVGYDF